MTERPTAMTFRPWIPTLGLCLALAACGSDQLAITADQTVASSVMADQAAPPPEDADATFVLSPTNPQAGEPFSASFDSENSRGGFFLLSLWDGDSWNDPAFLLESDANGSAPQIVRIPADATTDVTVEDYGVEGPGPDGLILPEELSEGTWRLCTANAVDDGCVQFVVGSVGSVPDEPDGADLASDEDAATVNGEAQVPRGELCTPGPDSSVEADETVDPERRGEALVELLTGIDELALQEEEEGVDIVYDDPNFGGVWGDFAGGWVVAVLDCSQADADQVAGIAGGADSVRLIQVPHTFEEVNDFRDLLVSELRESGVAGDVLIDSTLTGRHIRVIVSDADQLDAGFGSGVPESAFTIEDGGVSQEG